MVETSTSCFIKYASFTASPDSVLDIGGRRLAGFAGLTGHHRLLVLLINQPQPAAKPLHPIRTLNNFQTLQVTKLGIYALIPNFGAGQTIVPYSEAMSVFYSSPLGQAYLPLVSLFFWIWFVNLIVAISASLPIYISMRWSLYLDGGMLLRNAITSVTKGKMEGLVMAVTWIISGFMLILLLGLIFLPYIL